MFTLPRLSFFASLLFVLSCSNSARIDELILAAGEGDTQTVMAIKDEGVNLDGRGLDGWTPITFAAKKGQTEMIMQLKALGADIHYWDASYHTALYWSAFYNHQALTFQLREMGIRFHKKDPTTQYLLDHMKREQFDARFIDVIRSWVAQDM